jgi:ATP-dependent DNA helicase RecQ
VCTGEVPAPGHQPSREQLMAARQFLRGDDVVIEPRKLWPSGVTRKGKIHGLREGRAVAFADDAGWADELVALQRNGHREVPPELLAGAVDTLRRWSAVWGTRPVAVVAAPAPGAEQQANRALAEHIGGVGRLPVLELFGWQGGASPRDSSSTPVVTHVEQAVQFQPSAPLPDGPVLVCATTMRTGWTMAVVAACIHEAGGGPVLPLVVHRQP